jgi:hypothetical protein
LRGDPLQHAEELMLVVSWHAPSVTRFRHP